MSNFSKQNRREFFRRTGKLASVGAAGWAWPNLSRAQRNEATRRPNFIFILIDDLGWTDLGCCGSSFYETPNLDRLAAQGMRFDQAYAACTVCSPTRASILTGKYPARLHLTDWISGHRYPWAKLRVPDFNKQLPLKEATIAEALKPLGYVSTSIGKWHLGGEDFYPEKQGFDSNVGGTHRGSPPRYFAPYGIPTLEEGPEGEYLTDRLADEAVDFIEKNKDKPFFLYWPHFAVHTPIQAKKDITERYRAKIDPNDNHRNPVYASMIQSVDEAVGTMLAKLDACGLTENTVVFFMSDNGGLMHMRRKTGPVPVTDNAPLRAGKGSAYEGGVRVPMFVTWPGKIEAGTVCETPVISNDFYPTILAMAGLRTASDSEVDGVDLQPVLQRSGTIQRDALYWHYPHYHPCGAKPYGAIRKGDYRLLEYYEDGALELYDLENDIGETRNLANEMPEKATALQRQLATWRTRVKAQMPSPNPDYDVDRAEICDPPRPKKK